MTERDRMSLRERHWLRAMDVNLNGVFHVCRSAATYLRATIAQGLATECTIVNVVSIDAIGGDRGMAAYNAAKAGALNFSRSLAIELAGEGIRINTVSPGAIDTPMAAAMKANPAVLAAFHDASRSAGIRTPSGSSTRRRRSDCCERRRHVTTLSSCRSFPSVSPTSHATHAFARRRAVSTSGCRRWPSV